LIKIWIVFRFKRLIHFKELAFFIKSENQYGQTRLGRININKSKVFGSDCFKQKISDKINPPIEPKQRGGDRRSGKLKQN